MTRTRHRRVILDIGDLWEQEGWNQSCPEIVQTLSTVNGKQYFVSQWTVCYRNFKSEPLVLTPES